MNTLQKILFTKTTIVSILGLIVIVIGIPFGIYALTLSGGASLGGFLILGGVFITFLIYVVDRIAAQKIETRKLNLIEAGLLTSFLVIYTFSDREMIFDISKSDKDYFVLVENNGSFKNSKLKYSFPFNRKLISKKSIAVISSIENNYQRINVKEPKNWDGLRIQPWSVNKINIQFYSNPEVEFTDKEIDSIITGEIKTAYNSGLAQ